MPSGRTHDRITLWALPLVTGVTFWQTNSSNLTLLVAGGFLFGGLMFGPDLDIYSRPYQRWGFLRFIWLPYQKSLRHRSLLSHGPIIGTTLRVVYLGGLIAIAAVFALFVVEKLWNMQLNWQAVGETVTFTLTRYSTEFLTLFVGLELGAMSHSLSDWGGSAYKRFQKQGVRGLLPPRAKMKKRKATSRGSSRGKVKTRNSRTKS
ncbi:metal-binding protein [Tolypothrix campylonemoides VB511288]|nr:metal-binding protein [Tolypothrix campylonemoides VB511288]